MSEWANFGSNEGGGSGENKDKVQCLRYTP